VSVPGPDAVNVDASPAEGDEPVGSIAEEAFKLFRAMTPGLTDDPTEAQHHADVPPGEHVCSTWCPVCRVTGFVRENPEAIAAVTESATALARSLRDLVESAMTPPASQEEQ
jgi:hypothetical protein